MSSTELAPNRPAALTRSWIPRTDAVWLEEIRMRHVGQVATWERTKQALRVAGGGDFEGLAEDERLAAELLAQVVAEAVELIDARQLDPVVALVDTSDLTVRRVRGFLRLDVPDPSPYGMADAA